MDLFGNKKIDLVKFANFPKCTDTFMNKNGSGCLMTALWVSMGFEPITTARDIDDKLALTFRDPDSLEILCPVTMWDEFDGFVRESYPGIGVNNFCNSIISRYDENQEVEALNLLWKLIEQMPRVEQPEQPEQPAEAFYCSALNSLPFLNAS